MTFDTQANMDGLTAYVSSDEEETTDQQTPEINPLKSAAILEKLKKKFPLDSAPHVPIRVSSY